MSAGRDPLSKMSDILVIEIADRRRTFSSASASAPRPSVSYFFGLMSRNSHRRFKLTPLRCVGRFIGRCFSAETDADADAVVRILRFLRRSENLRNVFFKKRLDFFFRSRNLIKSAIMDNDFMKNLEATQVSNISPLAD